MTVKKRLERLLKAELRKSRIPGWQEEERLSVDKTLGLMEKAYTMGKDEYLIRTDSLIIKNLKTNFKTIYGPGVQKVDLVFPEE